MLKDGTIQPDPKIAAKVKYLLKDQVRFLQREDEDTVGVTSFGCYPC
jgi:hypothetical protein